jgi:hypothetical protein
MFKKLGKVLTGKWWNRDKSILSELDLLFFTFFGAPRYMPLEPVEVNKVVSFLKLLQPVGCSVELIRLGSENDGGYVVPDVLEKIAICISAGISDNCDFEYEVASRGIPCHMVDFSVEKPPLDHPLFHFEQKFLAHRPSGRSTIDLKSWTANLNVGERSGLLKLDIEGSEWQVLNAMSNKDYGNFAAVVIEFHWLELIARTWSFELMYETISRLLESFDLVNIHPNNFASEFTIFERKIPRVIELSFIHKDLNNRSNPYNNQYQVLNAPNNPNSPELVFSPEIESDHSKIKGLYSNL